MRDRRRTRRRGSQPPVSDQEHDLSDSDSSSTGDEAGVADVAEMALETLGGEGEEPTGEVHLSTLARDMLGVITQVSQAKRQVKTWHNGLARVVPPGNIGGIAKWPDNLPLPTVPVKTLSVDQRGLAERMDEASREVTYGARNWWRFGRREKNTRDRESFDLLQAQARAFSSWLVWKSVLALRFLYAKVNRIALSPLVNQPLRHIKLTLGQLSLLANDRLSSQARDLRIQHGVRQLTGSLDTIHNTYLALDVIRRNIHAYVVTRLGGIEDEQNPGDELRARRKTNLDRVDGRYNAILDSERLKSAARVYGALHHSARLAASPTGVMACLAVGGLTSLAFLFKALGWEEAQGWSERLSTVHFAAAIGLVALHLVTLAYEAKVVASAFMRHRGDLSELLNRPAEFIVAHWPNSEPWPADTFVNRSALYRQLSHVLSRPRARDDMAVIQEVVEPIVATVERGLLLTGRQWQVPRNFSVGRVVGNVAHHAGVKAATQLGRLAFALLGIVWLSKIAKKLCIEHVMPPSNENSFWHYPGMEQIKLDVMWNLFFSGLLMQFGGALCANAVRQPLQRVVTSRRFNRGVRSITDSVLLGVLSNDEGERHAMRQAATEGGSNIDVAVGEVIKKGLGYVQMQSVWTAKRAQSSTQMERITQYPGLIAAMSLVVLNSSPLIDVYKGGLDQTMRVMLSAVCVAYIAFRTHGVLNDQNDNPGHRARVAR